ncbi:ATP-binding protein [Paractinoplanes globisporus]|uniref:ATP-binding protein n=1 Tax=Paractinoplanes globisporus TaxID=113565 RepID=A0ABW6WD00_9ACTN|nr:AAA family ATPase [Actinoplanes globisporus]
MKVLAFAPLDVEAFNDRYFMSQTDEPGLTLGELLREHPAFSLQPLEVEHLDLPVRVLALRAVPLGDAGTALYLPPGIPIPFSTGGDGAAGQSPEPEAEPPDDEQPPAPTLTLADANPEKVTEREAVLIAHDQEINRAAAYLHSGLSVLIRCEKLLVEHLINEVPGRAGRETLLGELPDAPAGDVMSMGAGRRAALLAALSQVVRDAKPDQVVVVPHLDLLAGGSDAALTPEARELTDVLYSRSECILLGFTDPSLMVPEVLANRFAVRLALDILPREVITTDRRRIPVGRALVTREEAGLFAGFDAPELYKHIAGMNAVRLRHALRFAFHQHRPVAGAEAEPPRFADLVQELRVFKAKTSSSFEMPTVTFGQIGGYDTVKEELKRAVEIVGGAAELPDNLRHDLVPRGFIFHGPPGTGKTLFAKAVANAMDATIQVVSGPEITDMYVGESERKVRELFAEARRNAPTVVVFDEFDSIAGRRSGRSDGGTRAGNAIVAQLLTELDGFRPEVPVLIIGTTNRIDIIDDALLRPSRFRPIRIDLPDEVARREIARVHAKHFQVEVSEQLLDRISRATDKMNGDEIRSIFRDARADELVGYPRRRADARRLGELVGALRLSQQEHQIDSTVETAGHRPGRRAGLTVITPARVTPRRPPADREVAVTETVEAGGSGPVIRMPSQRTDSEEEQSS